MEHWKIVRANTTIVEHETYHFVGVVDGFGRVSSPIDEFDANKMTGKTRSGREYHLVGPSTALPEEAQYVLDVWEERNETVVDDVTSVYLKEHR